jgi:4-amino-4-deoxy-L-arabinose transferase
MVASGNYLEPTLNNQQHWTKPPLTYWAIAGGMKLLGKNEWGVRLYNVLAFCLTVMLVAWMGSLMFGRKVGLTAGFIYASSPFPVFGAFVVSTDTLLTLWETAAMLCFVRLCVEATAPRRNLWAAVMWVFLGLGFLTKGPPALLVLIPIVAWSVRRRIAPWLGHVAGILLFIVVGCGWYLYVCYRHPGLLSYFVGEETINRMMSSETVHNRDWYKLFEIYLPVLTAGAGLWIYQEVKLLWQKRLFNPATVWRAMRGSGWGAFLLIWLLPALLVFFASRSRLQLYVLPLYVPLAIALAASLYERDTDEHIPNRVYIVVLVSGLFLVAGKAFLSYWPIQQNMRQMHNALIKVMPENAKVVAYDRMRYHGLQFYLDGRMARWSMEKDMPWANATVEEGMESIKNSPDRSYVLVLPIEVRRAADDLFRRHQVPYEPVETPQGMFFIVRAPR